MMRARSVLAMVVIAATTALGATGCVVRNADPEGGAVTLSGAEDINPQPRSALREGGNLRVALDGFPANFNYLTIDGAEVSAFAVTQPTLPTSWVSDAHGNITVDHDYFTDAKLISTSPQIAELVINPKAVWSDGTPITVADLQSLVQCQDGHDPRYLGSGTQGFNQIASVTRGVNDHDAIVTFRQPYSEWLNLFSPIYPKSVTSTPDAFNNGLHSGLPVSAGPFKVDSVDRADQRIVLGRNPLWWGAKPQLDTITFEVLDSQDWVPGLQNNEIDAIQQGEPIHLRSDITMVRNSPNLVLRHAPGLANSMLTFNGAHSAILADEKLRLAVATAVNREAIVKALLFGVTAHPVTLNNHVYLAGQPGYQDNSALLRYDPDAANRQLDALGWRRQGAWRYRDGRRLELRYATTDGQSATEMAEIVQQNLSDVGVKVDIQSHPATGYFSDVVDTGQFDIAAFGWNLQAFPLAGLGQVYSYDPANMQGNYGRIGSDHINDLVNQAVASLNPTVTHQIVNEVDRAVWQEGHSLPLYQEPGNYPQRTDVANYGSFGLASPDYTVIGFLK